MPMTASRMNQTEQNRFARHFVEAEIVPREDGRSFIVSPIWRGVDRPNVGGIAVGTRDLANRMRAAMTDGAAFGSCQLLTDVNGATYIHAGMLILGRHANAQLKALGY